MKKSFSPLLEFVAQILNVFEGGLQDWIAHFSAFLLKMDL